MFSQSSKSSSMPISSKINSQLSSKLHCNCTRWAFSNPWDTDALSRSVFEVVSDCITDPPVFGILSPIITINPEIWKEDVWRSCRATRTSNSIFTRVYWQNLALKQRVFACDVPHIKGNCANCTADLFWRNFAGETCRGCRDPLKDPQDGGRWYGAGIYREDVEMSHISSSLNKVARHNHPFGVHRFVIGRSSSS